MNPRILLSWAKILVLFVVASLSACGLWNSGSSDSKPESKVAVSESLGETPFSTREPESYQAEIVTTSFINGKSITQTYFVARSDGNFVQKFGENRKRVLLRRKEGKSYVIDHQAKSYRELTGTVSNVIPNDKLIATITSKWLNEKVSSTYEKVGNEKDLTKYRVQVEGSKETEILVFVDEEIKLPVRQEFYSTSNGKKDLTFKLELQNFSTDVKEDNFVLPAEYRLVGQEPAK